MNNLIEITNQEFNVNCTEAEFEAHYDDYIVKGTIDCETFLDEPIDESVGIMSDSYRCDVFNFWHIETTIDGNKVSLNKKELASVKHDVENHFDKLVQSF